MRVVTARPVKAEATGRVPGNRLLVLGLLAVIVAAGSFCAYAATHPSWWTLYPVDLGVYRDGGLIVRHVSPPYNPKLADPLYGWPSNSLTALKFTYPPFAALVFAVVSFVPWSALPSLSVAVNVVALLATVWFTLRALGYSGRVRAGATLLGAAAVFWTEPVGRTIYLGQVNLVLMAAIIWDLTQPDTARSKRWKGIVTGLAAGIKLVPLIFIPYLLVTRKFRQAAMAAAGFAGSVLLGFAILPGDSAQWWIHGLFWQDGRTGFAGWGGNQSLHGLITRLAGSLNAGDLPWLGIAALVGVAGLAAAALLDRAGHPVPGLLLAALIGLLDSPISWDHHWVWVAPGTVVAAHYAPRCWRAGARLLACCYGVIAALIPLLYWAWPGGFFNVQVSGTGNYTLGLIWWPPESRVTSYELYGDNPNFSEYHWHGLQLLAGNAYVLAGIALFCLLVLVAGYLGRDTIRRLMRPRWRAAAAPCAATARTSGAAAAR